MGDVCLCVCVYVSVSLCMSAGRRGLHGAYNINQQLSALSGACLQQNLQLFRGEMERRMTGYYTGCLNKKEWHLIFSSRCEQVKRYLCDNCMHILDTCANRTSINTTVCTLPCDGKF